MPLVPSSVRGRLWTALGLLALAIVCISTLTWIALQRVDARLQDRRLICRKGRLTSQRLHLIC